MSAIDCHSLWIGDTLPPVAAGCLRSFVRHGHPVFLHVYRDVSGIPSGVQVRDASLTVKADRLFRFFRTGSYAPFADYFRLKLLEQGAGLWIDTDVYCIRPIDLASDHVFGWQDERLINNAVLRLPPDSEIIRTLVAVVERMRRPRWLPLKSWIGAIVRAVQHRMPLRSTIPWGTLGPDGITWCIKAVALEKQALPVETFYPIHFTAARSMAEKHTDVRALVKPATLAVHLFNETLSRARAVPEAGSFIQRIAVEGAGGPPALVV